MGRELWGFGPAYFSGGLNDGQFDEACAPLEAFLSWRPRTDQSDVTWDDYGEWGRRRLKDEKRHVHHFDSRGLRKRQADLRITLEARPIGQVVLRQKSTGQVQGLVLLQARYWTFGKAQHPSKWAEYQQVICRIQASAGVGWRLAVIGTRAEGSSLGVAPGPDQVVLMCLLQPEASGGKHCIRMDAHQLR